MTTHRRHQPRAAWIAALGATVLAARSFAQAPEPAPTAEPAPPPAAVTEAPDAAKARPRPQNRNLVQAKELLAQGRIPEAQKELDTAATLPGNTTSIRQEIAVVRAQLLLLQKPPNEAGARGLVVQVLHADPEGKAFDGAAPAVLDFVQKVRGEQPLVLHDRMAPSRPGRPIKLKAKLVDPQGKVAGLTLHFRGHGVGAWVKDAMRRDATGWSGLIREPASLAPPGVSDGYLIDYFLTAEDASGRELDSNGVEEAPLQLEITSASLVEEPAPLPELRTAAMAPPVVAETKKPWYLEWYVLAGAGVVLAGTVAGITAAALSEPDRHPNTLGVMEFP
jgi:hypothetical protein